MHSARFFRRLCALWLVAALLFGSAASASSYTTLEFGSRGSAVLKLQKALLALGFDPGGTDGKFGRGTENAVISYQTSKGLEADGKAGSLTQASLYADEASASSSSDSSGSASTPAVTNPATLKYGDSGDRVTELQTALVKLGYSTGGVDGRFGAGTQKAVVAFQKANKLTADGLAGAKTQALLYSLANSTDSSSDFVPSGDANSSDSSANSTTSSFTRTLRKGCTGADVSAAQAQLQALGYYAGSLDGVYGTGTMAAVTAFQKQNGLTADGLTGKQTWNKLFAADASGTGSGDASGGSADSSGGSADSPDSSAETYATLRSGSKGDAVTRLQQKLKDLSYSVSVTGTYDSATVSAVKKFQSLNSLSSDGVAGALTQAKLYGGSAIAYDENKDSGTTAPEGDTGKADGPSASSVKLLHWYNEVKPSIRAGQTITIFDPATSLQWKLRLYSLGHHADSEPLTLTDTQIQYKAFGNTNTWTPKAVYVQLPSGTWTLATMHNVPHLSGSIKDNGFDGHLCVHFLRDMAECQQNDPNYGVTHQNAIRKKWQQMTGVTLDY